MATLYMILYLFAAVCFALAAMGVPVRTINLLGLGLFFWVLVPLIMSLKAL